MTLIDATFPDDGEELAEIVESELGDKNRLDANIRAIEISGDTVATTTCCSRTTGR